MIKELYDEVRRNLKRVRQVRPGSHLGSGIIRELEQELLNAGSYIKHVPREYPSGLGEELGARTLKLPADALYDFEYEKIPLRIGTTTLHIQDLEGEDNIDAVVLAYMGDALSVKFGKTSAEAHAVSEAPFVLILDNGVIAAAYVSFHSRGLTKLSWYPEGMEGHGRFPYPENSVDAHNTTRHEMASHQLFEPAPEPLKALIYLVMFSKERYINLKSS